MLPIAARLRKCRGTARNPPNQPRCPRARTARERRRRAACSAGRSPRCGRGRHRPAPATPPPMTITSGFRKLTMLPMAAPMRLGRIVYQLRHDRIVLGEHFRHLRAFHLFNFDVFPFLANALRGVIEQFLGPLHLVLAPGDRLQLSAAPPVQHNVADLAGVVVEAAVQLAVEDDPSAHAGAHENPQNVFGPLGRPVVELAVGAHARRRSRNAPAKSRRPA